jgi:hypothetical protein
MVHVLNCNIGGEGVPYTGLWYLAWNIFPSIWPWTFHKYFRLKLIYGNTIWILIVASNLFVVWSFHLVIVLSQKMIPGEMSFDCTWSVWEQQKIWINFACISTNPDSDISKSIFIHSFIFITKLSAVLFMVLANACALLRVTEQCYIQFVAVIRKVFKTL